MEIAPTTNSFWGNVFGNAPAPAPAPTPAAKSGGMVFNVGEGLDAAQTKTAYEKIATPDLAQEANKNSFWNQFKPSPSLEFRVGEGLSPEQTKTAYQKATAPQILSGPKLSFSESMGIFNSKIASEVAKAQGHDFPASSIPSDDLVREATQTAFLNPVMGASSPLESVANGEGVVSDYLLNFFAKTNSPEEIQQAIKNYNLPEDVSKTLSEKLAKANSVEEVKNILTSTEEINNAAIYQDSIKRLAAGRGVENFTPDTTRFPSFWTDIGKSEPGIEASIPHIPVPSSQPAEAAIPQEIKPNTVAAVEEAAQRARMGQIFGPRPERMSSPEAFRYDPYGKKVETIPTGETKIIKRTDKLEVTRNTLSNLESKIGDPKNAPVDFKGNTLEDLQQKQVQLEAMKDAIDNNQLKNLEKYEAKSGIFKGELPEVLGKSAADLKKSSLYKGYRDPNVLEFMRRGDYYIGEAGFDDSEAARSAYQGYKEMKEQYKSMVRNFSEDVKAYEGFYKGDVKSLSEAAKTHAITMEDLEPPTVRGDIKAPKLDFTKWNDKNIFLLNRDTFERNLDKVATPEDAKALKEFIVNPVRANELGRIKFTNSLKIALKGKLEGWGIKRNTLSDELIQKFGEREISLDELKKAAPKNWQQIQSASNYFRNIYDDLLDTWNAERKAFGFSQIPKVPNYFRHFDDINFFVRNYGFLRSQDELPTEIAGKTEFFKPGKPFTTAELSRTSNSTKYSAIGGFNNYIDSVSKQIFHIDSVQRGRAIEKYLENAAKLGKRLGEPLQLSNIMANIREYVNNGLSGKTATLDRAIEGSLGRPAMHAFQTISKLIGKNIIVGNISTALSHLVTIPLNMATVEKIPLVKGGMTTLTSPFMKDAFTSIDGQESSFLMRRYPMEEIMPSKPKTAENALSYLFQATDKFKSRMAVASKYYEGVRKGLSPEEAMKAADIYGGKLLGDYSLGQKPNIMNTKTFHLLAQFQLGLNDSMSVLMRDIPHESGSGWKVASAYIQFAIFSYLFNLVLKNIRGAGKGVDPIDLGMTLTGLNDQSAGLSFTGRLGLAGKDLAGELPFASVFTGNFPLATAISQPVKDLMAGNYGKAAEGVIADFASPIGGGLQVKKTLEGAQAIAQGGVFNKAGVMEIPQGTSPMDKVQSLVFGKYASQAAQNYFDKASIDAKAQAPIKKIYDQVQALKASGKAQEAQDLVDKLSDADYATYKTIRTNAKRADTLAVEKDMYATVQKVNTLKNAGKTDEAQAIVNDMTDAEYKIYQRVRDKGVSSSEKTPSSSSSLSLGGRVAAYFSAATTDPIKTFHDIFAGQAIKGTKNGAILVDRMSLQESEAIKKSLLPPGARSSDYQLDHIIPLELGGTNERSNLKLLTKAEDQANNDMENYLGKALGSKKISAKQAVQYMLDYKQGKLTAAEIKAGI